MTTLQQALEYTQMGLSVVPVEHGTKRPLGEWKEYQSRIATIKELDSWFLDKDMGLGIVCGKVSGNLVCLDFDSPGAYEHFAMTRRTNTSSTTRPWQPVQGVLMRSFVRPSDFQACRSISTALN
jgi:hypothetical protein